MKVLIDTNVALNILLRQDEFFISSKKVFDLSETGKVAAYISASAITDIFYIVSKRLGKTAAREAIKQHLVPVFKPATVTDGHIYKALNLDWDDFEDSVQYVVGEDLAVDYIVTRNARDFVSGSILAVTPEQFIEAITVK